MSASEIEPTVAAVRDAIERWDVRAAREYGERARALAMGHGDARNAVLTDILLARATLLTSSDPRAGLLLPPMPSEQWRSDPVIAAALERFEWERWSAIGPAASMPEFPAPVAGDPADRVAAAVLAGALCLENARPIPAHISNARVLEAGTSGWQHLLTAIGNADGWGALEALDRALALAEHNGLRALWSAALRVREQVCRKRDATEEARAAARGSRQLLETWFLTLPTADARSAAARPDHARLLAAATPEAAVVLAPALFETASRMAQERDANRLIELALDAVIELTRSERGILLLSNGESIRVAATRYVDAGAEATHLAGLSTTVALCALKKGEVVLSNDVRADPRFEECASVALDVTSVLCIPIHARAEIEGALYLDRRRRDRPFEPAAVATAKAVGTLLAASLLNARTIAALECHAQELEKAREDLALALATRTAERNDMSRRLASIDRVTPAGGDALVGSSAVMSSLRQVIQTVAASDAPVLVAGETGAGKELVARAVHAASARRDRPFVALNCGALSETLLAAELFGSARGAYTGSTEKRPGLFAAAHLGTLLLDEVGDMPLAMQTALLRTLESGEVRPVGSTQVRKVDVRVIAASHHDLVELVKQGRFRDDLRYRLEVVRIEVPALRRHLEDLPELCEHLIGDARRQYGLSEKRLSAAALDALRLRTWRGNVRELRHVLVNGALTAAGSLIEPGDLPAERAAEKDAPDHTGPEGELHGYAFRADAIRRALLATRGHRGRAAKLLGVARSTLYRYCDTYGIELADVDTPWGAR
jgi:transcriptional regulator with GAF, ATPase, and Fis domain